MQIVQPIKDVEKIKIMQCILKKQSVRDWLLFTIGINSGLHLSDILELRVKDVKEKVTVSIHERNTGKIKSFILSEDLLQVIEDYISNLKESDYLFRSQRTGLPIKRVWVYRILNEAAKKAGIEDIGTHTMRKTFGYHTYKQTKDALMLKELFNHSAPSVTLKYIGIKNQENVSDNRD